MQELVPEKYCHSVFCYILTNNIMRGHPPPQKVDFLTRKFYYFFSFLPPPKTMPSERKGSIDEKLYVLI